MTIVQRLDDDTLRSLINNKEKSKQLVIIDIREPSEFASEHIAGSKNIPASKLEKIDWSTEKEKTVIVTCRMGHRTKVAEAILLHSGLEKIYCLSGGLEQWKSCGLPTESDKNAPLDIMRQVQIVTGSLILLSLLFAYVFSPNFLLLAGFVGAGLMMAGVTGFCGMARLLARMPWNKFYK